MQSLNPESRAMLPRMAFSSYGTRFREPKLDEGFEDITKVDFLVCLCAFLFPRHFVVCLTGRMLVPTPIQFIFAMNHVTSQLF